MIDSPLIPYSRARPRRAEKPAPDAASGRARRKPMPTPPNSRPPGPRTALYWRITAKCYELDGWLDRISLPDFERKVVVPMRAEQPYATNGVLKFGEQPPVIILTVIDIIVAQRCPIVGLVRSKYWFAERFLQINTNIDDWQVASYMD